MSVAVAVLNLPLQMVVPLTMAEAVAEEIAPQLGADKYAVQDMVAECLLGNSWGPLLVYSMPHVFVSAILYLALCRRRSEASQAVQA